MLRKKFAGQPEHVVNYLFMVAEEARQIMAQLGFRTLQRNDRPRRLPGDRTRRSSTGRRKASTCRRSSTPAQKPHADVEVYCTQKQDHGLDIRARQRADRRWPRRRSSSGEKVASSCRSSTPTAPSARCSRHEIVKRVGRGRAARRHDPHQVHRLSAGQSFGAFLAKGVTLELEGDANDYVGKGLSGGRIVIYPPTASSLRGRGQHPDRQRRALRRDERRGVLPRHAPPSGSACATAARKAVIEGVGDHGCEYMTGGRVVVLGPTGRNFAAGMSGGIAYVWDADRRLRRTLQHASIVELEASARAPRTSPSCATLIEQHRQYTGSTVARNKS